uniref:Uncharacterized protein n=1 Tax=Oncorhynchus kisutch TaxID=8019 RepID=A0A8C7LAF1_ONCKI
MSTSTSTAPKEFLLSPGKVFERDVPFSHMENIKKETGPEKYHPHHACLSNNDKQTVNQAASPEQNLKSSALQPLQNCPGTVSSVTTPPNMAFAHARDLIMDSEYEVQGESKNQCKLTSTGASGQLYLNDCHRQAKRTNREKIMSSSIKETEMSHYTPKTQDLPMHFASSDINPFAHQWQEEEPNQSCYKNQVFGSAADISCKSPLLDSTTKHITRCCSVDNGLNVQNSPFNSHLSTYANNKGLSSTLSSMEEDFKDQTSLKAHLKERTNQVSGVDDHNQQVTLTMSCNSSSCYNVSGDLGNSTGQVDEIMLVYDSSERAFQETTTQTTINHGDLQRRNNHHRKSSTRVPVLQKTTEACRETTTWASLQNMSEHLSQLIVNTSDLLGNVQGMRSGESLKHSLIRNVKSSSHLYSSTDWMKRDCSTKTAVDIGIQTERTLTPVQDEMSIHQTLSTERSKAHEVNVIVKVIGSEVLTVSQDKGLPLQHQLKKNLDDNIQSMPDLLLNAQLRDGSRPPRTQEVLY